VFSSVAEIMPQIIVSLMGRGEESASRGNTKKKKMDFKTQRPCVDGSGRQDSKRKKA